jgi:hypothetical protein
MAQPVSRANGHPPTPGGLSDVERASIIGLPGCPWRGGRGSLLRRCGLQHLSGGLEIVLNKASNPSFMISSRADCGILSGITRLFLWAAAAGAAFGQSPSDLYRITDGLHTLLEARGRGQYVGSILQAVSKSPRVWFGEGDTIFHLDGKSVTHSPGTEDEYGSCWEDPRWRTFASLYCGHPLNENGVNRMYRWYMANPVRFQQGLKVEIQNQHDNGHATTADADDYTSLTFWYQEGPQRVVALPGFKNAPPAQAFPTRSNPAMAHERSYRPAGIESPMLGGDANVPRAHHRPCRRRSLASGVTA